MKNVKYLALCYQVSRYRYKNIQWKKEIEKIKNIVSGKPVTPFPFKRNNKEKKPVIVVIDSILKTDHYNNLK